MNLILTIVPLLMLRIISTTINAQQFVPLAHNPLQQNYDTNICETYKNFYAGYTIKFQNKVKLSIVPMLIGYIKDQQYPITCAKFSNDVVTQYKNQSTIVLACNLSTDCFAEIFTTPLVTTSQEYRGESVAAKALTPKPAAASRKSLPVLLIIVEVMLYNFAA